MKSKKITKRIIEDNSIFDELATEWWKPDGSFRALHAFNFVRIKFIKDTLKKKSINSIRNLKILDIGCGGGILCEPLARLGAKVTGIDENKKAIEAAKEHSKKNKLKINYKALSYDEIKLNEKFDVLIVAGFQGISDDDRITTLGRGGSDTSAVALAKTVKADLCEIYTDVEGIFTSDPRIVRSAKKIKNITYEEILEMSSSGSKVLHPRSVELAMKYGIKIHVRSTFSEKLGTMVVKEEKELEKEIVTGISVSDYEANVSLKGIPDKPGIAGEIFSLLSEANINVDMIVQNITDDGRYASLTFTVPVEDCSRSVVVLKNSKMKFKQIKFDKNICKVSIVGVGMKSNVGVAKTMFETLAKKNINIKVISTSEIKISVLIDSSKKRIALNALHKAYKL